MPAASTRRIATFAAYGALFVALVLLLLRFQGVLGRPAHDLLDVPTGGPAVRDLEPGATTFVVRREEAPVLQFHPARVEACDPARIAARVMAVVQEVTVREGDTVEEGALLVQLDDTDATSRRAQASAALEAATARVTGTELTFDRAEKLNANGNLTAQAFEGARAERDAARANEVAAREALAEADAAVAWHRITAPFAGRVLAREVERGDLAQPGRVLVSLYRADALRVIAALPERHGAALEAGALLVLDLAGLAPTSLAATRVLPESDAATGTLTVQVDLPRELTLSSTLRPGVLGRVGVATGVRARIVVPEGAVERIGQVERVWLVREGHAQAVHVRTVPVNVAPRSSGSGSPGSGSEAHDASGSGTSGSGGSFVEVLSGLAEGDTVLVR
ncbi:MAG: efflux RND transporter periplasmic adaptor subunit [Planctomycetota bacterium]